MIYDFLGHQIVVNKIQSIAPPVCNTQGYAGEAYFDLKILFYGEQDYKSICIPLIKDEEFFWGTFNNDSDCDSIILLNGKEGRFFITPLSETKAAERIMPIYLNLIEELKELNK